MEATRLLFRIRVSGFGGHTMERQMNKKVHNEMEVRFKAWDLGL